jgi:hypothetical protein
MYAGVHAFGSANKANWTPLRVLYSNLPPLLLLFFFLPLHISQQPVAFGCFVFHLFVIYILSSVF